MPSLEAQRILQTLPDAPGGRNELWQPLEARRQGWESYAATIQFPPEVKLTPVQVGTLVGEWVEYGKPDRPGVMLWFHGGGFNSGSSCTHRELGVSLSQATGMKVFNLDYRLAPEHPFPAALGDGLAAYQWLFETGLSASDLVIGGDSAGGQLTVSTLIRLRDAGLELPKAVVLLSPWLDLSMSGDSIVAMADDDPMVTLAGLREAADWYLAEHDPKDPLASPVFADLQGLPPMVVQVGEHEVLLDDAVRLSVRAKAAGVRVELEVWEGMWHVFQGWAKEVPEAMHAIRRIAEFLNE